MLQLIYLWFIYLTIYWITGLTSALQTATANRSSTATLGDIWKVEKRVRMVARTHSRTHTFSRFSFQFFARLRKLKVKTVQNLSSYHFAGGGKVWAQLFCVSESWGVWGASVGWRNVKSTEEFAPSVAPRSSHPPTLLSPWPMGRTFSEARRWRRSLGSVRVCACTCVRARASWLLTKRLTELYFCAVFSEIFKLWL